MVGKLFLGIIFLITVAGTFYLGMDQMELAKDSESWLTTQGEIYDSLVEKSNSGSGGSRSTSYSPRVVYRYNVDGKTYSGNRLSFGEVRRADYTTALSVVDQYPKGKEVVVYYNPKDPGESTLKPGVAGRGVQMIQGAGALFFLIGILMFLSGLLRR